MQSQRYFGADSMIHGLCMRYLDRRRLHVYAACNGSPQSPSAAFKALEGVPDLTLRSVNFGPTINAIPAIKVARSALVSGGPCLVSLVSLARFIRQERIDIVHCTEKPRDAFYGVLLARAAGARCVIHVHVKAEKWMSPFTRWAMKHADALIGVSAFVARSIVTMGYSAHKTYAVANSLDLREWDTSLDGGAIRREFGLAPDVSVLAIVARLFHWKGHRELLQALARVPEPRPVLKLLIVGEDDPRPAPEHGRYSDELRALVQELELRERVVFTGFRRDIPRILAACDVFALPSYEEPFGVSYLEAMAMKRPVVALDSGGTPEVVQHGRTGLLSPPWDVDRLAGNIATLVRDPEERRRMGVNGHQRVENDFNPQRMVRDLERVYRRVLGRE
jgi:glycosyltransferase involved in cell wall biosynthesis